MKKIKLLTFFLIPYTLYFILNAGVASAEGLSLKIYPSLLQIKVRAPAEMRAPITIENLGNEPVLLTPQFRLIKPSGDANGKVEFLPQNTNKPDSLNNIELFEGDTVIDSLTLGANQKRDLVLKIRVDDKAEGSDMYSSTVFLGSPREEADIPDETSFSKINTGIAMNVFLSVESKAPEAFSSNAVIEEFKTKKLIEKGPVEFTVKVKNNSSNYINPKGNITITNMFDQTIGKVDLASSTILADSSRYLFNSDDKLVPNPNVPSPMAHWGESFLLGPYVAKLTLILPGGQELTQTTRFFAVPARFLVGLVVAILFVIAVYRRVKARMTA